MIVDSVALVTEQLALERRRYKEQAAELAALHEHCRQLSSENEELRSEVGALRVEAEASRVAVQDATQAVLDAGAELSIARAREALGAT